MTCFNWLLFRQKVDWPTVASAGSHTRMDLRRIGVVMVRQWIPVSGAEAQARSNQFRILLHCALLRKARAEGLGADRLVTNVVGRTNPQAA